MKKLKKRFIVPAVVFILGMCALIGTIYVVGEGQEQQNRTNAKLNAMTYTERIYGELMEGIGVTDRNIGHCSVPRCFLRTVRWSKAAT